MIQNAMRRYVGVRARELRRQIASTIPDRPNPHKPDGPPYRPLSIRFETVNGSGRNGGKRIVAARVTVRGVDHGRLNDLHKIDARTTAQLDRWCDSVSKAALIPVTWEAEGGI